jgi:hypothetical protein
LRLDEREAAIASRKRGAAIVPGNPDASLLWQRISSSDPHEQMPPPNSNKRLLSAEERELIRRWIADGAVYEPHWAFIAPERPAVPEVDHSQWCRTPVDRFVLARLRGQSRSGVAKARLEAEDVQPSPEAGRAELIRRLFLDLTGLPPTPEETDAFLMDNRPDAYERWIDKLFTEEPYRTRYAERMAVPWLDASRYADTCGIHMDAGRQMWLWRDWVLQAYRNNMPFDRFVTEQLAGDLLPNATVDQKIASGFNRNHVTTDEGGAINEEYLVEYAVDRASTTGSVFLGLTLGCARCHEHKFDPVSQEEFYQFYAFFNSNDEPGLYSQRPDPNRALEPFLVVPTPEQKTLLASLREKLSDLKTELNTPRYQEDAQREAFVLEQQKRAGLVWEPTRVTDASSLYAATLTVQADGSVLAGGNNPAKDEHFVTLQTEGSDLRLLMLEALPHPSLPHGRIGRAPNGNAVLAGVEAEAVSLNDTQLRQQVRFVWAWADVEQGGGEYQAVNVLDAWDDRGWAVDGEGRGGVRVLLLVADKPFGFAGGTQLRVNLKYDSPHAQHTLGRVRLTLARFADRGLDVLPTAVSGWYRAGPFAADSVKAAYDTAFGPEQDLRLDTTRKFGTVGQQWRYDGNLRDGQPTPLAKEGINATYLGRRIYSPDARKIEVSLGSDDGFALYVNGQRVAGREIDRGVAADQDKATIELRPGINTLVLKVVNNAGGSGFYYRSIARPEELSGDLLAVLVPESARSPDLRNRFLQAWRVNHAPGYRGRTEALASTQSRLEAVEAKAPRTMIMSELPKPRETFLLLRGEYSKPDKNRPVSRGVPAALGKLPEGAPANRLGLAQWMTESDNALVARVAVNRLWEMLFGTGIVRTSEDFGLQGEWPSHPELLDWLAVEFRESGWNIQHMLKLMLTSSTYRQSSHIRPELRERDPDNRMLAFYPRRRLAAEFIRDQALYVSGLLIEQLGGPSVKPYQPDGLWKEVAMLQSNTRIFERGDGPDLWRRSLYTYWKRASPPPSLLTFDAPTRESCVIRRPSTNTPLQALVLWNDEQYVEAARLLAQRTLGESQGDRERLIRMFRRCTGRAPEEPELRLISETLAAFRERYRQAPEDAARLLQVGEAPAAKELEATELAAWTMIANALLNLSATITQS